MREELETLKNDHPERQVISPSKFDDKFILEDKVRDLNSFISKEFRAQKAYLSPLAEANLEINVKEDFPSNLATISEEVSNIQNEVDLATGEYQRLQRDKRILEK